MRFLTHSRTFRVVAVILTFMLVSAACSGDDDTTDGPVVLDVLAEAGDEATLELATAQFTEMYPHVSFNITLRAFDDYMQIAPGYSPATIRPTSPTATRATRSTACSYRAA